MSKPVLIKIIELIVVVVAFGFMAGCRSKSAENTTHVESGSLSVIRNEIYNDCLNNNDTQGAQEVLDTHIKLTAFCCKPYTEVKYDDVKNRNFENFEYDIGELQIAVAAYNEYNEESVMDVEADWMPHYNSCTQEQIDSIDAYVDWYHNAQNGNYEGTIKYYSTEVFWPAYYKMLKEYDIKNSPNYDDLTPAQFKEVQNYMKDPSYQVDTSVFE